MPVGFHTCLQHTTYNQPYWEILLARSWETGWTRAVGMNWLWILSPPTLKGRLLNILKGFKGVVFWFDDEHWLHDFIKNRSTCQKAVVLSAYALTMAQTGNLLSVIYDVISRDIIRHWCESTRPPILVWGRKKNTNEWSRLASTYQNGMLTHSQRLHLQGPRVVHPPLAFDVNTQLKILPNKTE